MNLFKQTKQDRDYLALQELLKPVEEQDEATGILSKPKKPEDEESMVTGFFSSMFDRSKQRSAELAQEMQEQQRISEEQEISDYLRRTTVSDALYDELKLPNPAYGGLKLVEDRPMTEAELEQYAPLLDLANDIMEETITVKELGAMNRMDQEAFLKSLSDLKVNERSSSFEGDTFEVASSREDFLRDLMKKREADTAKPKDDEASRLKEFLLREETDSTSDDVKPVDADTIDADGGAAPSGKGLMSPVTDDDMGLPSKPSKVEELKDLYATKGPQYKKDQIVGHSYVNDPLVEGGVRGKSRVHGDASIETQNKVIDSIVAKGREADLSDREIALVLAIAKHESGFNPDAAAGTTSARGLGQFVNKTGKSYGITKDNQWDLDTQIDALIAHTKDNMDLAKGKDEAYVYAYHHDGPSLQYGGLKISKDKVMPLVDKFEEYLKSKGELQEPNYPDQTRATSPRPMLRPEEDS